MQRKMILAAAFLGCVGMLTAITSLKTNFNKDTTSAITEQESPYLLKNKPAVLENINMNFLLRSSLEMPDGDAQSAIRLNEARFEVMGTIVPDLDFRVRYRLNRSQAHRGLDNAPGSLDIAAVNYKFGKDKKWSVNVGKQAAYVGSWEFETNPTYEYQYSEFINFQTNIFLMGMRLGYQATENHGFYLQLHNTYNESFNVLHANTGYNADGLKGAKNPMGVYASWIGKMFDDKFHTFWSYNISQYASDKTNHSFALGNKINLNKLKGYLDLQSSNLAVDYANVASPSVNNYKWSIASGPSSFARDINYKSAVLRLDYEFAPGWFATGKGIWESASQKKSTGSIGSNFRENIGYLVGLEYKPIASQNMKLFGYYYNSQVKYNGVVATANDKQTLNLFSIGVLYFVNAF